MSLALVALEPKIEQLLEALDRIAEASERSAAALEKLTGAQLHAMPVADVPPEQPDLELGRLDGIG